MRMEYPQSGGMEKLVGGAGQCLLSTQELMQQLDKTVNVYDVVPQADARNLTGAALGERQQHGPLYALLEAA